MSAPLPGLGIYFATESGNAQDLAERTHRRACEEGWSAALLSLPAVRPADLANIPLAVFIVSTWGDGDPPSDADDFWCELESASTDLHGLRYTVFGLGDSSYWDFNGFARKLDQCLARLGAQRISDRTEADVDFEETFLEWEARIFSLLAAERDRAASAA